MTHVPPRLCRPSLPPLAYRPAPHQTDSIDANIDWLGSRLGIEAGGRLQRVVFRFPLCLVNDPTKVMEPRLACLTELGVPEDLLGPLVVRTPSLLQTPFADLRERVEWIREAGGVPPDAPASAIGEWLRKQPDFFSVTSKQKVAVTSWLRTSGLSEAQAASVLATEPSVLMMPIAQLQLRASFFLHVMGGTTDELATVPHMLTCDLAKAPMLRHAFALTNTLDLSPTQLLVKGDEAFCDLAGVSLDRLNAFEADGKHLAFFQGSAM